MLVTCYAVSMTATDLHAPVDLRNGSREQGALLASVSLTLDRLLESMPLAVFDLVELARNGSAPFPPCAERLIALGLMASDGRVHESIRNIVLSSFEGDGMDMYRVSPLKV